MALRNINNKVLKAWYELLHNNISVPVYRTDAPASEEGNYVLIRKESDSETSNNSAFVTRPVIITEVVTRFSASIDEGVAQEIDDEIAQLLYPSAGQNGLPIQTDIQITTVNRVNATDIAEDDGTFKYYRIVTRNVHRVLQTPDAVNLGIGDFVVS